MKLAYFSPFNPQPSGISDYSEELLPHLAALADIDLFVDGFQPANPGLVARFSIFDYQADSSALDRLPAYDAIVYHMGNDHRYHAGMLEVMRLHPGVVVFHDFALQDFFLGMARERNDDDVYLDELQACNGADERELATRFLKRGATPPQAESPLDYPLNCRLAREAEGIIVHSEWSRSRFREIAPATPIARVNHHITPDAMHASPHSRGEDSKRIRLASFGLVTPEKGIERALQALGNLRDQFEFDYTLVGPTTNFPDLNQLVRKHNLQGRVTVTGHVTLEEFKRQIAQTDIAINLRERPVGATSGSLCRIMAAGVAAIVSDVSAFSELPNNAVVKIDAGHADALLEAYLRKLMQDRSLRERVGANAREHVRTHHRIEDSAARYISFIHHIIERRSRTRFLNGVSHELSVLGIRSTDGRLMHEVAGEIASLAPAKSTTTVAPVAPAKPFASALESKQVQDRGNGQRVVDPESDNGRFPKLEGIDYKRAAVEYLGQLTEERRHHLRTKPFYNLANKPSRYKNAGMDEDMHRHFCDFANMAVVLALPPGSRILDVGCGSGWLSEYFARLGYEVKGIDISPSLIEMSRERVAAIPYGVDHETPLKCSFEVHDIEESALKENFDAIVCYDSLHHLENERGVFRHLSEMLDIGGLLFILEGQRPATRSTTGDELRGVMREFGTLESPFSYDYLRSLICDNGFSIVGDYVSVNGLFDREMLEGNSLPLATLDTAYNYLTCMKVVANGPAAGVPDSRNPGELKVKFAVRAEPPKTLLPGAKVTVPVTITNAGNTVWLTAQTVRAGVVMPGVRIFTSDQQLVDELHGHPMLARAVAPGMSAVLQVEYTAPAKPGKYSVKIDLVDQHICWFEEKGSEPLVFHFEVAN